MLLSPKIHLLFLGIPKRSLEMEEIDVRKILGGGWVISRMWELIEKETLVVTPQFLIWVNSWISGSGSSKKSGRRQGFRSHPPLLDSYSKAFD